MSRTLFGTDGVRGIAGEYPLDATGSVRIGRAVGMHFAESGQTVILGFDPRESSEEIAKNIIIGLNDVGVNVVNVGVLPTPGISYLTRETEDFVAGIMITASHNPYNFNGVKVFDAAGDKLPDSTEAALNDLIESEIPGRGKGSVKVDLALKADYEKFLVNSVGQVRLEGLSIAIDSANGAASGIAKRVFEALGTKVTSVFDEPDGKNINAECGATNTKKLADLVTNKQLSLGVAVDGDADRLFLIDSKGREINGDLIMYILASTNGYDGVVATVMSNLAFEQALKAKNIRLERTKVGDRYVLEALESTGYKLGGEQSGHIILPKLLKTGDALLAAVQTVKAINDSGMTLEQWHDEIDMLPQAIVNVDLNDKAILENDQVKEYIAEQTRSLGSNGRILIRPSGTEPLVRVMVEAPDAQNYAAKIAGHLSDLIKGMEQT